MEFKFKKIQLQHDDRTLKVKQKDDAEGPISELIKTATSDTCPSCGLNGFFEIDLVTVDMYDHEWGWWVGPDLPLQWLSIKCPRCEYEISFTKFGIKKLTAPPKISITLKDLRNEVYWNPKGREDFEVKFLTNTSNYKIGQKISQTKVQDLIKAGWAVKIR